MLEAASLRGWNAVGADISRRAVRICRQKGFECHTVDGHELPFDDESFDIVTGWSIIEHVIDVSKTLIEWRRVLRSGGVLAMDTSDAACLKAKLLLCRRPCL